ncbi:CDP-alcohol phosphatidyltransferase family protein, partial [Streptococcus sobrinus]
MIKKENIPNLLTIIRIFMIPVFLILTSISTDLVWNIV